MSRHSGQAGDSQREPESRKWIQTWIPAFAGKTDEVPFEQTKIAF